MNALIEADRVELLEGAPEAILTPSASGQGQRVFRCADCRVALWSVYPGAGPKFLFLRVGALENPNEFPPDIHIFVSSKQPWLALPSGVPAVEEYYRREDHWPSESLARREAVLTGS